MPKGPARFLPWLLAASLPAGALLLTPLFGAPPAWLWAAIGAVAGLSMFALRPQLPTAVLIGAALLALSGFLGQQSAPKLAELLDGGDLPFYDLTEGPLPNEATGRVRVRGHLISEPKLDEYAVAKGGRPDQNEAPLATVRLFLPTPEFAIPNEGRYLAARVMTADGAERQNGADLVEGVLRPLPQELVLPIFGGHEPPEGSQEGWLLDAGDRLDASDIAIDIALCLLAAVLALMSWLSAFAREGEEASAETSV